MAKKRARDADYVLACQMLVDLASDAVDICGMAMELNMAWRYGSDEHKRGILKKIAEAYLHA